MDDIRNFIESEGNIKEFARYLKSYEFSLCFCLHQILEILLYNPEFLDFKEDPLFIEAYCNKVPRSKFPTDTEMCIFANNIFGLIDKIFKVKTHEKLTKIIFNVREYITQVNCLNVDFLF